MSEVLKRAQEARFKRLTEKYIFTADYNAVGGWDYLHVMERDGLSYYIPNDDCRMVMVADHKNNLMENTTFFEMDDMEPDDSEYAFVNKDGVLIPIYETL